MASLRNVRSLRTVERISVAVRPASSPESSFRSKTFVTADFFFARTASLNGLSSRRKRFSGLIFIRRPVPFAVAQISSLGITMYHHLTKSISNLGSEPDACGKDEGRIKKENHAALRQSKS